MHKPKSHRTVAVTAHGDFYFYFFCVCVCAIPLFFPRQSPLGDTVLNTKRFLSHNEALSVPRSAPANTPRLASGMSNPDVQSLLNFSLQQEKKQKTKLTPKHQQNKHSLPSKKKITSGQNLTFLTLSVARSLYFDSQRPVLGKQFCLPCVIVFFSV